MRFDLSKYSTVAERLAQFHQDHPDGRITTELTHIDGEIGKTRWVIKSTIYLSAGDQANYLAKATGYAFEVDGTGGANATSALENGESSSIGRALMVAGYAMSKDSSPNTLASREEMSKVVRGSRDYLAEAKTLDSKESLRLLWAEAKAAKEPETVLDEIKGLANGIGATSVNTGAATGVPGSDTKVTAGKGTKSPTP
jgi:hypothetical protein